MLRVKIVVICFLAFGFQAAFGQTGKVSGKVIDANTGEELIGASVYLKSKPTIGVTTDLDGRFLIENAPVGKDTLVVSYISYLEYKQAITITAGKTLEIAVALSDNIKELGDVIIQAERNQGTMNSLYIEQKKSAFSGNGITADAIKKTPDNNSGDALKRVSGATIQGGKFAIIRGLNERYNLAMINGSPLPSTEPEKRAFSLDLVPANMLEQLVVVKSATPEYPGDWSGGVILIKTKEVPEDPFFNISVGGGYNSLTTFKPYMMTEKMKGDWIGMGNKTRALPNDFPTTDQIFHFKNTDKGQLATSAKLLPNNFGFNKVSALPNGKLNLSGGRNFKIGKNDRLGVVFSGIYSNSRSYRPVDRNWWTTDGIRALGYHDSTYSNDVRLGGLLNLTYKIGQKSKISFKNIYNHNAQDLFTLRHGKRDAEGNYLQSYSYQYTYNRVLYSQVSGEHVFRVPDGKKEKRPKIDFASSTLSWQAGYGTTERDMPDYRNIEYVRQDSASPFRLKIIPQNGSEDVSRLFLRLQEDTKGASFKWETPYEFSPMWKGTIKVGFNHQFRNRYFHGRFISYSRPSVRFDYNILQLPVDQVFSESSFFYSKTGQNGLLVDEITRPYHSYFAQSNLNAGFIQLETRYGLKHRLIYGARYESYRQVLQSKDQKGNDVRIDTTWNNLLPSFNYIYEASEKTQFRASYFRSVSRPDFRELAPFAFIDFQTFSILKGNPNLQVTTVDNAEIRYDIYAKPGEVYSFSLFYKRFKNPIELLLDNSITIGAIGRTYTNLPYANSYGFEFDFRKSLDFIDSMTGTKGFGQFTLNGNFSYIKSVIDLQGNPNTFNPKRPMQGQSPYILNFGVQWESKNSKWMASGMVNRYGERIYNVGTSTLPDIYEKARTVIDMQISRKLAKDRLELKASIQDLLAQKLIFFFDYDSNKKYNAEKDWIVYQYKMPRTVGFSVSYKF
ncbi:MAG: TonB-dependent receptor [Bacteroidetes bacterium]|nr:TonB-dependent receptor [Bacteroidota bacterium]